MEIRDRTLEPGRGIVFTSAGYNPAVFDKFLRDNPDALPFRLVEGVYRIDAPGKATLVVEGGADRYKLERPNGILITPDDRYLYIADNNNNTHGGSRKLLRYTLDKKGDITGPPKVLFDWKDGRGPDGMKMDAAGRIYVAAGTNKATEYETNRFKAGCYILSPSGRLIDFIPTAPDEACNCAFGGKDGKTLFITSGGHLWCVPLK
ncbi:MAG TPA: SMP-30/gluconolactonase/LRE family protein [Prosthecobacter sp.]|nr:SMP-30/gluconolactonase/LRE family protein [Prosthecobacter sp.]